MLVEAERPERSDKVIRAFGALLLAGYPVVVWLALTRVSVRPLSICLAVIVTTSLLLRIKGQQRAHALITARIPLSIGGLLLLGALFDDRRFVLALPVLTNVVLLAQFGASLRTMPMAERFARASQETLRPSQIAYCRSVTIVWCVFFVINGTVTGALALFSPLRIWAAYAGGVSYALVGLVAAIEYVVRKIRFRRDGRAPWDRLIARAIGGHLKGSARSLPSHLVRNFDLRPRADRPFSFDVHVPVNLAYFAGHFEGHAILPGVVQLEVLVARQVAATWPELTRIRRVTRLRFRRPIRPGDHLVLDIQRPERARVDFDVRCGAEPCSSGTLHFEV